MMLKIACTCGHTGLVCAERHVAPKHCARIRNRVAVMELGRKRRCDNGDVVADQIGSHLRQTIIVPVGPFSAMATSFFASALAIARMA